MSPGALKACILCQLLPLGIAKCSVVSESGWVLGSHPDSYIPPPAEASAVSTLARSEHDAFSNPGSRAPPRTAAANDGPADFALSHTTQGDPGTGRQSAAFDVSAPAENSALDDVAQGYPEASVRHYEEPESLESRANPPEYTNAPLAVQVAAGAAAEDASEAHPPETEMDGGDSIRSTRLLEPGPEDGTAPKQRVFGGGEICQTTPVTEPATCTKTITIKKAYPCDIESEVELCKDRVVAVPSICTRKKKTIHQHPCAQTELHRHCSVVNERCVKVELELQEYECGKEVCIPAFRLVQEPCMKPVLVPEITPCMRKKMQETCRQVSKEVTGTCYKDVVKEVPYSCTKTEIHTRCNSVKVPPHMCKRAQMQPQSYVCMQQQEQEQCHDVPVEVASECQRRVLKEESYKCTKTNIVKRCKKKTVKVPSTCVRPVTGELRLPAEAPAAPTICSPFDPLCSSVGAAGVDAGNLTVSETFEVTPAVTGAPALQLDGAADSWSHGEGSSPVASNMAVAGPAHRLMHPKTNPCTDNCEEANKVTVETSDINKVPVATEKYPCEKMEVKKVCKRVPQKVTATCKRDVEVIDTYPCLQKRSEQQCQVVMQSVEAMCYKNNTYEIPYPCTKTEIQRVCKDIQKTVKSTCTRHVTTKTAFSCPKTIWERACKKIPVSFEAMCTELVQRMKPHTCIKNVPENQCKYISKTCKRSVEVKKENVCPKEKCENVMVPVAKVCSEPVIETETFKCTKKRKEKHCETKTKLNRQMCYHPVDVQQEFPCARIVYRCACSFRGS